MLCCRRHAVPAVLSPQRERQAQELEAIQATLAACSFRGVQFVPADLAQQAQRAGLGAEQARAAAQRASKTAERIHAEVQQGLVQVRPPAAIEK
jgi:hypothetical protein